MATDSLRLPRECHPEGGTTEGSASLRAPPTSYGSFAPLRMTPRMTGLTADYVEAAQSLAPLIETNADRIERDRALPKALVDALIDAGIFRLLLPRSLGGVELDLPTHIQVVEQLARADASVAWCVGQANGLLNYIAYAEPSAARA